MNEIIRQRFYSPTKGKLRFSEVMGDIAQEVRGFAGEVKVSVGTDSEEIHGVVKYVSLIHMWRVGNGARAYRTQTSDALRIFAPRGLARFRDRIWKETMLTATLAQEVRSGLREKLRTEFLFDIEVHADVGEHGGSSQMIREVIGMFKGYGFQDGLIKLKPEAYAASCVADRYI